MSPSNPPVLDLDAELLQLEVKLGGQPYALRNRSELSVLELHHFSGVLHRYDELTDIAEVDDETAAKIGAALQEIAATLVVSPPASGFSDQQCSAILSFWTEQSAAAAGPPPKRPPRAPQDRLKKQPKKTQASTGAR